MSDDLMARLREASLPITLEMAMEGYVQDAHAVALHEEAADRIEQLEAALVDMVEAARTATDYSSTSIDLALQRTVERDEARAEVERLRGQGIPAKVCGASFDPIDASHPIEWLRGRKTVELAFEDPPKPTKIGADWLVVLADIEEADDA